MKEGMVLVGAYDGLSELGFVVGLGKLTMVLLAGVTRTRRV